MTKVALAGVSLHASCLAAFRRRVPHTRGSIEARPPHTCKRQGPMQMLPRPINYRKDVLRGGPSFIRLLEVFKDPLVTLVCLFCCAWLSGDKIDGRYAILGLVSFSLIFPGDVPFQVRRRRMLRMVFINWLVVAAILFAFGEVTGYVSLFPAEVLVAWLLVTPVATAAVHEGLHRTLMRYMFTLMPHKRAVIVGANEVGSRLARELRDNPYLATNLVGFFDDRERSRIVEYSAGFPLLGNLRQLSNALGSGHIDRLYLSLPMASQPRILQLLDDLKNTTVSIYFVPDIFVTDIIQGRTDEIGGMPVVALCETPFTGINGLVKRLSDIVVSTLR